MGVRGRSAFWTYLSMALGAGIAGAVATIALLRGISLEALANILVAAGTFVLAYFTWKSVSETKEVISGEDLRFRQSRMPMLRLEREPMLTMNTRKEPGFQVIVQNDGDGPARDVEVRLRARVAIRFNILSEPSARIERPEVAFNVFANPEIVGKDEAVSTTDESWFLAGSYVPQGGNAGAFVRYAEIVLPERATNNALGYDFQGLEIRYTDVFGARFCTEYLVDERS